MNAATTLTKFFSGKVSDFPADGGIAVKYESRQIAVFYFAARDEWFACDNRCPHKGDNVLARGILGDAAGVPKVACPMHKRVFSLKTGDSLNEAGCSIPVYDVLVEGDDVFLLMPGD